LDKCVTGSCELVLVVKEFAVVDVVIVIKDVSHTAAILKLQPRIEGFYRQNDR